MDHAKEANMALPKAPILFTKPRSALTDPYPAAITIPKCAQDGTSDYEAELCVVIGKSGRDIPEDDALDYVLGYTCSNDVSARALQMLTAQWSFSKGLDNSCPIGTFSIMCLPSHPLLAKTLYRTCACIALCHSGPPDPEYQIHLQRPNCSRRQYQGHDLQHQEADLVSEPRDHD